MIDPKVEDTLASPVPNAHRSIRRFSPRVAMTVVYVTSELLLAVASVAAADANQQSADVRVGRMKMWMQINNVGLGLRKHSERNHRLPYPVRRSPVRDLAWESSPNGTGHPLYSWRLEICPQMRIPFHGSGRLPWNSPGNRGVLAASWLFTYDDADTWVNHGHSFPEANILAITGPGTAFGDGEKESPKCLGDVPQSTVIAVEVRSSGIPWPAPGDLDVRTMPRTINSPDGKGISSRYSDGFHLLFADAHVWFVSHEVPFQTLEKLFTLAGAATNDRETLLGPYAIDRGPKDKDGNWVWDVPCSVFDELRPASQQAWMKRGEAEWQTVLDSGWTPPPEEHEAGVTWVAIAAWTLGGLLASVVVGLWFWHRAVRRFASRAFNSLRKPDASGDTA